MSEESKKRLSRRKFVALTGSALAASGLLAACGDATVTTAPAPAATTAAGATTTAAGAAATTAAGATTTAAGAAATTAAGAAATTAAGAAATTAAGAATTAAGAATAAAAAAGPTDYNKVGKELVDAFAGKLKGTKVSIAHGVSGEEEKKFQACFKDFQDKTGITVNLIPGNNETSINVKVESNTTEDIVNFPQPGLMGSIAKSGKIIDLNKVINQDWLKQNYKQGFIDTNTVDGPNGKILGGIFQGINFKSAVWYPKKDFDAAGYKIPTTWAELKALSDQIVKDGDTPWAIGIESGSATGWPATDWIEDIMLRTTTLENYDKWTKGELPFTSPEVKNAFQIMTDIWFNDKYVYGGRKSIPTTNFGDAPTPMLQNPPKAWLHRQGTFITSFFEKNKPGVKAGVDYDFFYLPPIDEKYGKPVLFAGDLFSMFKDRPEVRAVIQFLTTYESIQPWIKAGGGRLSPHQNVNLADYTSEMERKAAQSIINATSARFDGSDLMPGAVGSGTFWKGVTDYVSGSSNLDQALTTMQSGWANVKK
jgi:alpha-glucoside transport system substrate-binding protein